jgi:hypothetical protein
MAPNSNDSPRSAGLQLQLKLPSFWSIASMHLSLSVEAGPNAVSAMNVERQVAVVLFMFSFHCSVLYVSASTVYQYAPTLLSLRPSARAWLNRFHDRCGYFHLAGSRRCALLGCLGDCASNCASHFRTIYFSIISSLASQSALLMIGGAKGFQVQILGATISEQFV